MTLPAESWLDRRMANDTFPTETHTVEGVTFNGNRIIVRNFYTPAWEFAGRLHLRFLADECAVWQGDPAYQRPM